MKKLQKKICCLLLVLIFLLNTVPAFADTSAGNYDGEILFRGIPWGSNYYEVIDALSDIGVEKWDIETLKRIIYISAYDREIETYSTDDIKEFKVLLHVSSNRIPNSFTVAGEHLEAINLYFIYTFAEDGTLPQDKEHTALYCAEYDFERGKTQKVANETYSLLGRKLSAVYGDGSICGDVINWYGVGTALKLHRRIQLEFKYRDLYIEEKFNCNLIYIWEEGYDLAKKANDYLFAKVKNDPGNTDGL